MRRIGPSAHVPTLLSSSSYASLGSVGNCVLLTSIVANEEGADADQVRNEAKMASEQNRDLFISSFHSSE